MSQDIIDRIQDAQEEQTSTLSSASDIIGMVAMLPFWAGLLQMFSYDEIAKLNGVVTWIISIIVIGISWYAPGLAAALHVPGKKFLRAYIFYGKRMVPRWIELIDDPQVIARKEDESDEVVLLEREESEYEEVLRKLGVNFLTDEEVDRKIIQALKDRYERIKTEEGTKRKLFKPRTWLRREKKEEGAEVESDIVWSNRQEEKK